MTPSERLDEILLEYFYPETYCGKKTCSKCKQTKIYMDEGKNKIVDLFMDFFPKKKSSYDREPEYFLRTQGWNECREEMIKNIEKLR